MSDHAGDHPLHIDSLTVTIGGVIGLTHCPGRCGLDSTGRHWQRHLEQDLSAIEAWGADVVVTLIETAEFAKYGMVNFASAMRRRRFRWYHVPIADFATPDERTMIAWRQAEPDVRNILARGGHALFHCAAGLGRTGSVAAKLLVDMGMPAAEAIAFVRAHRPGAIETAEQLAFVANGPSLFTSMTKVD